MSRPWRPIKRSPVHHKLVALGAVLVQVSGCSLAKDFGDADEEATFVSMGVGMADVSSVPKLEAKGTDVGELLGSLLTGQVPEPGGVVAMGLDYVCRVSRNHALFILDPENPTLTDQIRECSSQARCVHLTDRTSGFGRFLVCGPEASAVLRKVTSVDLRETIFPDLRCACAPMVAIRTIIVRRKRSKIPGYEIFFSFEYGEYLWDALMEAGQEFQIRPFGLAAAQLLEQ